MKKYKGKKYKGEALLNYARESDEKGKELVRLESYFPSDELIYAVEIARILGRPLLLRGEPGVGKTRLAEAIAYELHGKNYKNFYFEWPIKSTTTAQEGLYTYDYLSELRSIKLLKKGVNPGVVKGESGDADCEGLVNCGPLGKAFITAEKHPDSPPILLVDEIDKADIDFPNDLLWELEKKEFGIKEKRDKKIDASKNPPIVIITSNNEKELPAPFLRRCVFHYIEFPDKEKLFEIVKGMIEGELEEIDTSGFTDIQNQNIEHLQKNSQLEKLWEYFSEIREKAGRSWESGHKTSTSEFLDWMKVILHYFSYEKGRRLNECILESIIGEKEIAPEMILLKRRGVTAREEGH